MFASYLLKNPCSFESTVVGEHTTHDMDPSIDIYNTTVFSYQAPPSVPSRYDHATGETLTSNESDSGDLNRTFVILIKIFWVVDILFICIYLGLFDYLFVIS